MSKIQSHFEFDQSNELHRKAQHYLETMDRNVFPTFGDVMVAAIVNYFDRYYGNELAGLEATPEGPEKAVEPGTDDLDSRIEKAVERALERRLPQIMKEVIEHDLKLGQISDDEEETADSAGNGGNDHVDLSAVENEISWGFLQG